MENLVVHELLVSRCGARCYGWKMCDTAAVKSLQQRIDGRSCRKPRAREHIQESGSKAPNKRDGECDSFIHSINAFSSDTLMQYTHIYYAPHATTRSIHARNCPHTCTQLMHTSVQQVAARCVKHDEKCS